MWYVVYERNIKSSTHPYTNPYVCVCAVNISKPKNSLIFSKIQWHRLVFAHFHSLNVRALCSRKRQKPESPLCVVAAVFVLIHLYYLYLAIETQCTTKRRRIERRRKKHRTRETTQSVRFDGRILCVVCELVAVPLFITHIVHTDVRNTAERIAQRICTQCVYWMENSKIISGIRQNNIDGPTSHSLIYN